MKPYKIKKLEGTVRNPERSSQEILKHALAVWYKTWRMDTEDCAKELDYKKELQKARLEYEKALKNYKELLNSCPHEETETHTDGATGEVNTYCSVCNIFLY